MLEPPEKVVDERGAVYPLGEKLPRDERPPWPWAERDDRGAVRFPRPPGPRADFEAWLGGLPAGRLNPHDRARLLAGFDAAGAAWGGLRTCPVCQTPDAKVDSDAATFRCTCDSCGSRWGLRPCGACGGRFPFLALAQVPARDEVRGPGWVDHVLGRDVLASPCWADPGEGFICSDCGHCPAAARLACDRCRPAP